MQWNKLAPGDKYSYEIGFLSAHRVPTAMLVNNKYFE